MGCIRLDIIEKSFVPMKVVCRKSDFDQKSVQRFLSLDPLTSSYPWYTPYQFAGNMPIKFIDLDGLEPVATQASVQFPNSVKAQVAKK